MPLVTNGTRNFTQVGVVRVAVREILRSRFGNQILEGTVAFQTPLAVNGVIRRWQHCTMTAVAGDILASMKSVKIWRV